jgi:hypothetical protein
MFINKGVIFVYISSNVYILMTKIKSYDLGNITSLEVILYCFILSLFN